jgi:hypothetical protein
MKETNHFARSSAASAVSKIESPVKRWSLGCELSIRSNAGVMSSIIGGPRSNLARVALGPQGENLKNKRERMRVRRGGPHPRRAIKPSVCAENLGARCCIAVASVEEEAGDTDVMEDHRASPAYNDLRFMPREDARDANSIYLFLAACFPGAVSGLPCRRSAQHASTRSELCAGNKIRGNALLDGHGSDRHVKHQELS